MGLFNRTREEMEKDFAKLSQEDKEALLQAISKKEEATPPTEETKPNPTQESKVEEPKEVNQMSYDELLKTIKDNDDASKKVQEETYSEIVAMKKELEELKAFKSKFNPANEEKKGFGIQKTTQSQEVKDVSKMSYKELINTYAKK